jgi:dihydrofolate reductase
MARLIFRMNVSLDGYVDHEAMSTGPVIFRHWTEQISSLAGSIYGRGMYEVMRYWDEDRPDWDSARQEFAAVWRRHPKWVVSRSLTSVGPNATLVADDVAVVLHGVKSRLDGEMSVSGPGLAQSLAGFGLIDAYQLYFQPVALGRGKPFFAGPRPKLRLVASDLMGEDVVRLTYVPG